MSKILWLLFLAAPVSILADAQSVSQAEEWKAELNRARVQYVTCRYEECLATLEDLQASGGGSAVTLQLQEFCQQGISLEAREKELNKRLPAWKQYHSEKPCAWEPKQ